MANVNDALWSESRGELIDRIRELEGDGDTTATIGRLRAELAEARALIDEQADALERRSAVTLETLADAPHLSRLDGALGVLAAMIDDDEEGDILQALDGTGETRLAVVASAIASLANARERLTPRPLPALR